MLTQQLNRHKYGAPRLYSSLLKFYGRHHNIVVLNIRFTIENGPFLVTIWSKPKTSVCCFRLEVVNPQNFPIYPEITNTIVKCTIRTLSIKRHKPLAFPDHLSLSPLFGEVPIVHSCMFKIRFKCLCVMFHLVLISRLLVCRLSLMSSPSVFFRFFFQILLENLNNTRDFYNIASLI